MSPMLIVFLVVVAALLAVGGLTMMPPLLYLGIAIIVFAFVMAAKAGKSQTGH